jgi:ABC-type uncharacterized transport system auxiliary subunit
MKLILALGLSIVALGGCLGKPGPVEEYLKVSNGGDCGEVISPSKTATVVAVRPFKSADALDRQAVMLARGRVSNPSLRWYWEATPAKMFEQSMASALNCTPMLAAAWPTRSTTEAAYSLTGTVSAFEVQEQNLTMNVSINCQLWDGKNVSLVGAREFASKQQINKLDAQSIAEACANALSGISAEVGAWVMAVAGEAGQARNLK